jgi:RNA ligase (TIGR02306 family)
MEESATGLAYVGKIIEIEKIPEADRITLATVVCGKGGRWRGVVPIQNQVGDIVRVFLPDAILPKDEPEYAFMEHYHWRVRQRKFKGMPSECLILPGIDPNGLECLEEEVGMDVTIPLGITKYIKPSTMQFNAESAGNFPGFIPKTDEPLFQGVLEMFNILKGWSYYITLKMDGMSATAFRWQDKFGVCSRNLEIKDGPNSIWKVVHDYKLDEKLPEGYAVQWETCGPGIQKNPMGLSHVKGYAFQIWDITNKLYLDWKDLLSFTNGWGMTRVPFLRSGLYFDETPESLQAYAETLLYDNGKPAEGLVCRPQAEMKDFVHHEFRRISFKVVNLKYKD